VIFLLELTHDVNVLLPLLLAVTISHGFTVLALRRSILTEKVSRKGFHLSREYAIDPLEIIFAREVARTGVVALPADASPEEAAAALAPARSMPPADEAARRNPRHEQRLFPIVDDDRRLVGVVTRSRLRDWLDRPRRAAESLTAIAHETMVVAYADEPLRILAYRMAETGVTRMPVVSRRDKTLIGMVGLRDLLTARARILEAEQRRERVLGSGLRLKVFGRSKSAA
jgi:CBS domain-containing protein